MCKKSHLATHYPEWSAFLSWALANIAEKYAGQQVRWELESKAKDYVVKAIIQGK